MSDMYRDAVNGVETQWLSGKEKVPVSKECHAESFHKDIKGIITTDFLDKDTTVNSSSDYQAVFILFIEWPSYSNKIL